MTRTNNKILFLTSSVYERKISKKYITIVSYLKKAGYECDVFCLDRATIKNGDRILIKKTGTDFSISLRIKGEWHKVTEYSFAYWYHPQVAKSILQHPSLSNVLYIKNQFKCALKSIYLCRPSLPWFNDPISAELAENKILQIKRAGESGLLVPETVITNSPEEFRIFCNEHKNSVIKTLAPSILRYRALFTSKVTETDINNAERMKNCPAIIQNNIQKAHDIRVTVVGSTVFPVQIESQHNESTRTDWRANNFVKRNRLQIIKTTLPDEISLKLLKFMKRMKLHYGAIDMIRTPAGEYYFLEVNPYGQWYFIEEITGLPIASTIAASIDSRIKNR